MTAVESASTLETATCVAANRSPIAAAVASVSPARMTIVAKTPARAVEAVAVVAVIPRAGTDEDAAYEPVRPVITIGRTCIRIVAVIPVGARWCWANTGDNRTYANAHADLCMSTSRNCEKQDPQQRCIFEITHGLNLTSHPG
jgi:hypothetical protein